MFEDMFEDKSTPTTVEGVREKLDKDVVEYATLLRELKDLDMKRKELMAQIDDSRVGINRLVARIANIVDEICED